MFPNYCDFGYWDYGYAEGDTKSIQTADGSITADGDVIAVASKTNFAAGDVTAAGTEVTFYGYASKDARDAGKQPLAAGKVQIAGDEYVAGADRAQLYAIIKQKPEFEGAEDC